MLCFFVLRSLSAGDRVAFDDAKNEATAAGGAFGTGLGDSASTALPVRDVSASRDFLFAAAAVSSTGSGSGSLTVSFFADGSLIGSALISSVSASSSCPVARISTCTVIRLDYCVFE